MAILILYAAGIGFQSRENYGHRLEVMAMQNLGAGPVFVVHEMLISKRKGKSKAINKIALTASYGSATIPDSDLTKQLFENLKQAKKLKKLFGPKQASAAVLIKDTLYFFNCSFILLQSSLNLHSISLHFSST